MKRKKSSVPLHKGPNDSAVPPKLVPANLRTLTLSR